MNETLKAAILHALDLPLDLLEQQISCSLNLLFNKIEELEKENHDFRNRIMVLETLAESPDQIRKSQEAAAIAAMKEPSHGTGSGGTGSEGTERPVGGSPPAEAGGEAGRPALG